MAIFESLVTDIETLFSGKDLSERISHLTDKLGNDFVTRFLEYSEERKPGLYMSNIGWPSRKLWYTLRGFKGEPLPPEAKLKFLYGTILESLVLFLAQEAGHEVTHEQKRVEVDGVRGKLDSYIDGVLVDAKSCSTRSFEKFKYGKILTDDPFGYIGQLSGYAEAEKAERAAFLLIDKVTGSLAVFELTPEVRAGYNIHKKIAEQKEMLKSDSPPTRCYEPKKVSKTDKTGNLILDTGCSYCDHRVRCWSDANDGKGLLTRFYSSGPKFFVKLVKEPRLKYEESFEEFPVKDD